MEKFEKNFPGDVDRKKNPDWMTRFNLIKKEGLRREQISRSHLPDDLRLNLMKISQELFSGVLSDLSDPDKIITDNERKMMFDDSAGKFKELKKSYPDYFKKKGLVLHEILEAFNYFVSRSKLETMDIEHHDYLAKSLAILTDQLDLKGKLEKALYKLIKDGIESRVPKEHQIIVKNIYKKYFPDFEF